MALSPVDLYRDVLPKTNCQDCGFLTCLAFAAKVVSERLPLSQCPHLTEEVRAKAQAELDAQYATGRWLKRDMAADALVWAKERAASMQLVDLPERIGGELIDFQGSKVLKFPFFDSFVLIGEGWIKEGQGNELNRWEQVLLYNHLAQGGQVEPTGKWKSFHEFPNTISKVKTMEAHVERPLAENFAGNMERLKQAGLDLGAEDVTAEIGSADLSLLFSPLPRVPVLLNFWDKDQDDGFDAQVKFLFDETIVEHLDVESIVFLSEQLCARLLSRD